ncbi:MAG: DUF4145 domain-containing protein [Chloroflexota bacterium]
MIDKSDKISLKKEGEQEMANLVCPVCFPKRRNSVFSVDCTPDAELKGIIKCLICEHELPITIRNGFITKTDVALPGAQSEQLHQSVSPDIKEDMKEAERAHYNQCDKACVTMCRRALQLGLIDRGITDKPLSVMLNEALDKKFIEQKSYYLATSIKGYGDIGAHRRDELNTQEVNMVIYATVKMLNELFA